MFNSNLTSIIDDDEEENIIDIKIDDVKGNIKDDNIKGGENGDSVVNDDENYNINGDEKKKLEEEEKKKLEDDEKEKLEEEKNKVLDALYKEKRNEQRATINNLRQRQKSEMEDLYNEIYHDQSRSNKNSRRIDNIFIWSGCRYEDIDKYILGGKDVNIKSTRNIFHGDESLAAFLWKYDIKYRTIQVIAPNIMKYITFLLTVMLPFFVNGYSIIIRWVERPVRDPDEFHNWSKLSLIHTEFAGLVIIISLFLSDFIYLFSCFMINCICAAPDGVNEKHLNNLFHKIVILISTPLIIFSLVKIFIIIFEESKFFIKHIETIDALNDTLVKKSSIIGNDGTKFGDLDYIPFLIIGVICFLKQVKTNIMNYNHFLTNVQFNDYVSRQNENRYFWKRKSYRMRLDYSIYDPEAIKRVGHNMQNIGKFSLLRVIVWTKHQLPTLILNKYNNNIKSKNTYEEDQNDFYSSNKLDKLDNLRDIDETDRKLKDLEKEIKNKKDKKDKKDNQELEIFRDKCWPCIYFSHLLVFISVIPIVLPIIIIFVVIIGVAFLSLIIKVSQISFVSELELLEWDYGNVVQFIAFLNNILSLDTGKIQSFNSIMTFMFSGEDASESTKEKQARVNFVNGLISYLVKKVGLFRTIITLPQLNTDDLQKIFIEEQGFNLKSKRFDINECNKYLQECEDDDDFDLFSNKKEIKIIFQSDDDEIKTDEEIKTDDEEIKTDDENIDEEIKTDEIHTSEEETDEELVNHIINEDDINISIIS